MSEKPYTVHIVITHTKGVIFPLSEDLTVSIPITVVERDTLNRNKPVRLLFTEQKVDYDALLNEDVGVEYGVLLERDGEAIFDEDYTKNLTNPVARWSISPAT